MFCKIILPSKEIHKLQTVPKSFTELEEICKRKFSDKLPLHYTFQYTDSDNELITLCNDEDLQTAIFTIDQEKLKTLRIQIVKVEENEDTAQNQEQNKNLANGNDIQQNKKGPGSQSVLESLPLTSSITDLDGELTGSKNNFDPLHSPSNISSYQFPQGRKSISYPSRNLVKAGSQEYDSTEFFTSEQLQSITDLIDYRIKTSMEVEIMKLVEEAWARLNNANWTRQPKKHMTYTMGTNAMKNTVQRNVQQKEIAETGYSCNGCRKSINGIRYCCTVCRDFDFCEECEGKSDHPHPFVKHKPSPAKSNLAGSSERNPSPPDIIPLQRTLSRSKTVPAETDESQKLLDKPQSEKKESATPQPFKYYQAKVVEYPTYDVQRVKPESLFTITFTIKNTGEEQWPENVKFICTEGMNQASEEKVNSLKPNQSCQVVLPFQAPKEADKYISIWKMHYTDTDGVVKKFGPNMFFEIHVVEELEQKQDQKRNRAFSGDDIFGKNIEPLPEDQVLLNKFKCTQRVLDFAKMLYDMFPSEGIEEKIEFVRNCHINMDLYEIVTRYLDYSAKKEKKETKVPACITETDGNSDDDDD